MSDTISTIPLSARHASLADLTAILNQQQGHKLDIVAGTGMLRAEAGHLRITGAEPVLTDTGVTSADGLYLPTELGDAGLGEKLGIPTAYLRKTRAQALHLYDTNVNGWLDLQHGKRYLARCLSDGNGGGILRAFLSDGYKIIDHLDVLMSALTGIRESGLRVNLACDLSERRMVVRVHSEAIKSLAPTLLRNYRSPFTGATGADNPTVFAGLVFTNSETGAGAMTITPRIVVQVCDNGVTVTKDALRAVHLGAKMDEGTIRWSNDTHEANLSLIGKQARDAVRRFLDVRYVRRKIEEIEEKAGRRIADPDHTIRVVGQRLRFTEDQQRLILNHFIDGGDRTAGGMLHAVTSAAQTLSDPDAAFDMESVGIRAMEIAATL
ncbi:DUF932 domain-containing protein [Micromonospora sp. M71_S20]|uniref:DUF932 domain-containing protein n=1 Tax=Micromonospora sp. M71_S20 TaxID=592872 RepID=UPI000EB069BE|nr:DUF932 domain-containing protein [Micromonospora sp. M71_S20]